MWMELKAWVSKLHSARIGKTFPVGCLVGGWLGGGGRLKIRLKLSTAQILPPASYLLSYSTLHG